MNQIHMRSPFVVRSLGAVWRPALGGPSSPNSLTLIIALPSTRSHHALPSLCLSFVRSTIQRLINYWSQVPQLIISRFNIYIRILPSVFRVRLVRSQILRVYFVWCLVIWTPKLRFISTTSCTCMFGKFF